MTAIQKTLISFLLIGACVLIYTLFALFSDAKRITSQVIGEAHAEQREELAASGYAIPQRARRPTAEEVEQRIVRTTPRPEPTVMDVSRGAQPLVTRYMVVKADWLNLRSGPSVHAEKRGVLPRGTDVEILGEPSGEWIRVVAADAPDTGWVHASFLAPTRRR